MDCNKVLDNLSLLIDGRLSNLDEKQIEKHLSNCSECREEYNTLKEVSELVSSLGEKTPPEGFSDKIIERVKHDQEAAEKDEVVDATGEVSAKDTVSIYTLRKVAVAAVVFFFLLGNSFIWAISDGAMATVEEDEDVNIKVDMRLAGPTIQVRDAGEDVEKSTTEGLTNEVEEDGLLSWIDEYSSFLVFNGIYVPVAAVAILFMRMKNDDVEDEEADD
ncbi:anti-sigma factor family protein [Natranaerofaba carboxydovora]|uniref:anti-sigma factor family protein n=1 Tax=Natranaerofaba carboxydovora TaxID=2742683 RepID=UPI001F129687|nr:zf-HC2 domain-containing protein [Natranaerofaba carboxydovora]UMZ72560.1 Putative zinc-finger [Natranaerofaba carboxydovora]